VEIISAKNPKLPLFLLVARLGSGTHRRGPWDFATSKVRSWAFGKLANEGYCTLSQQCEMILIEWVKEKGYLKDNQE